MSTPLVTRKKFSMEIEVIGSTDAPTNSIITMLETMKTRLEGMDIKVKNGTVYLHLSLVKIPDEEVG